MIHGSRRVAAAATVAFLTLACSKSQAEPSSPSSSDARTQSVAARSATCAWPEDRAAVSLTYDDNAPTQLSVVAPALAERNLRATFFLNDVTGDPQPWAELAEAGHELGSHTMAHPCPAKHSFVKEGNANEDYDLERMAQQLDDNIAMLESLGQKAPLTFAYPCGITWVGKEQQSYVPLVEERFLAARGVTSQTAGLEPNMLNVPAYFLKSSGEELIARLHRAQDQRSWVVFGFHGIGGDWEVVSTEAHAALLDHLVAHRDEFYVAPFGEIAACLKSESAAAAR